MATVTMIVFITAAVLITVTNLILARKADKIAEYEKADRGDVD
ncbi:hypothetical protein Pryu01_01258 [Paraliobacillus ryukyuensis]|uniref:Uncharacterized protein n=1 Tax=Paraliobacillus ryukyuensis TaxID=200904 RepID=A0A366EDM4_9BACI|nr:hypothetical protein [Paraliobacillus ryukyuensis]RBO99508.1 hypothetical protein DES48_104184 [Paraliobacillus ryukyuensis]